MKSITIILLLYCLAQQATAQQPPVQKPAAQKTSDSVTPMMKPDRTQLKEIVVRAVKPLYQMNASGMVVNVDSSLLTKGSSVLTVLERSPGVTVDHQNSAISLNGKSGVMIMVDGKLMRMPMDELVAWLNTMSADDIESIELLSTPSARYDAEGSAGIISLVMKKKRRAGTSGSVSLTGGYGWREKGIGNINLTHHIGRISLSGSYTFSHDRSYNWLDGAGTQNFPALGGAMDIRFGGITIPVSNSHQAILGISLPVNSNTTVGININLNQTHIYSLGHNYSDYDILPDSLLTFKGQVNTISRWTNVITSIYLEKKVKDGGQWDFDMDWLNYQNSSPTVVQNAIVDKAGDQVNTGDSLYSPSEKGFSYTGIQVGVVKIDYSRPLSKGLKWETGVKGSYTWDISSSGIENALNGVWVPNTATSNNIVMTEGIGAAYINLTAQLNPSVSLVAGFRYEYSHSHMDDPVTGQVSIDRKLGDLFPDLFFSQKLNDHTDWQMSYTRRISRPSYNDLASFIGYSDPAAIYTGNPLLKPTITDNIKWGINYRGYSGALLLSTDRDPIAPYQLTQNMSGNLLYISPQNLSWQNNATLLINVPWKVNHWWSMNYSFTGGFRHFKEDYTLEPAEKGWWAYSVNASQVFRLGSSNTLEISGWYNSPSYNGTTTLAGYGMLNGGFKKELKKNKGVLQLSVADFFRTLTVSGYHGYVTREVFSIVNHFNYHTESARTPIFKLSYSRSFGGTGKAFTGLTRTPKEEEERGRKN